MDWYVWALAWLSGFFFGFSLRGIIAAQLAPKPTPKERAEAFLAEPAPEEWPKY